MATHFKRGGTILIPYKEGWSISDSQGKPRMYKTKAGFDKAFPKHYIDTEGVELVEYAEVRHGEWLNGGNGIYDTCTYCKQEIYLAMPINYCPSCGARMDGGKQDA